MAPGERLKLSPDASAEFYDRAFGEVYRYLCRAVLGNRALAEDLTQDTFASVVASVHAGHAELHSMPWVIGVARHKLIDHYRRTGSERRRMALVWAGGLDSADDQLADLDRGNPQRVVDLLGELSSAHRLVLILRYVDELTIEEIANSLGRSVHATESLLVRARHALKSSYRKSEA
jgi:RNA polymerase sigma-70 factor (ECF subfamily)